MAVTETTDLAVLRAMLDRAGVEYTEETNEEEIRISVEAAGADGSPNRGYFGFYATLYFRLDGALCAVGASE